MTTIAEGMIFQSFKELHETITAFGVENHIVFVKFNTRRLRPDSPHFERLQYAGINYACKQGKRREKSRSTGERPNQQSFKVECPLHVQVACKKHEGDYVLKVKKCVLVHRGHPVGKEAYDLYPENCRVDYKDEELKTLVLAGASIPKLREYLVAKYNKPVTKKKIYNLKARIAREMRQAAHPDGKVPIPVNKVKKNKYNKIDKELAQHLVNQVQMRPVLYDSHHECYTDKMAVDFAYKEIGLLLDMSAEDVKDHWQRLQKSYFRFKTRLVKSRRGIANTFYLQEEMSFLDQHYIVVTSDGNTINIEVEDMSFEDYEQMSAIVDHNYAPTVDADADHKALVKELIENQPQTALNGEATLPVTVVVKDPPPANIKVDIPQEVEHYDPDNEFWKGLLPQVKELNKSLKRKLFHTISTTLFTLLEEQDNVMTLEQTTSS